MPTYEYKCEGCGHQFERFQSITAAPIKKCPECGKNKVRRLIGTGAGLIFKGSGFYITDYRSEGYKSAAKSDSSASSSNGGESKSGGESKPAASSESSSSSATPAKGESKPAAKSSSSSTKKK
jgi:putative FmdB family regulatory protein